MEKVDTFSGEDLQKIAQAARSIERDGVVAWRRAPQAGAAPKEKKRRADLKLLDAVGELSVERMRQAVAEGAMDLPAAQKRDGAFYAKWLAAVSDRGADKKALETLALLDELGLPVALNSDEKTAIERPALGAKKGQIASYRQECVQSWCGWVARRDEDDEEVKSVAMATAGLAFAWTQDSKDAWGVEEVGKAAIEEMRDSDELAPHWLAAFCAQSGQGLSASTWDELMDWIQSDEDQRFDVDGYHGDIGAALAGMLEKSSPGSAPMSPKAGAMLTRMAIELDSVALLASVAERGLLSRTVVGASYDSEYGSQIDGLPLMLAALKSHAWDKATKKGRSCFEALARSPQAVEAAFADFDATAVAECYPEEVLELFERFPRFAQRGRGGVNVASAWAANPWVEPLKRLPKLMGAGFGHMLTEQDDEGVTALERLEQTKRSGNLDREAVEKFMKAFAAWESKGMKKEVAKPAKRAKKGQRARL